MNTRPVVDPDRLDDLPRRPIPTGVQAQVACSLADRFGLDLADAIAAMDLVLAAVEAELVQRGDRYRRAVLGRLAASSDFVELRQWADLLDVFDALDGGGR